MDCFLCFLLLYQSILVLVVVLAVVLAVVLVVVLVVLVHLSGVWELVNRVFYLDSTVGNSSGSSNWSYNFQNVLYKFQNVLYKTEVDLEPSGYQ